MSLSVTSSKIEVHSPAGDLMFTSSSKLIYEIQYATGTKTITSSDISIPYTQPTDSAFTVLNIKITASTTTDVDDIIGLVIPINANIQTGLHTNAHSSKAQASSVWLSATQEGDNIVFKQAYSHSIFSTTPTMPTISFTYYFRTYSYL